MRVFVILLLCLGICYEGVASSAELDINDYRKSGDICADKFKEMVNESKTTSQMLAVSYDATECYVVIINQIIDKHYSRKAQEHKEALNNYIKTSYTLNNEIYFGKDSCPADCGSTDNLLAKTNTYRDIKQMFEQYLSSLER